MKNKRNLQISLIIAVVFLITTIFYTFISTHEESSPEKPAVSPKEQTQEDPNTIQNNDGRTIIAPEHQRNSGSETPEEPSQDLNGNGIADDLDEQVLNQQKELPDDLKEQVRENNEEPVDIPEDIKRSMAIPPHQVSIDEVNNPTHQ